MKKISLLLAILASLIGNQAANARPPLESFRHYTIMMVHGVSGSNPTQPKEKEYFNFPHHNEKQPRKSAIFDLSGDDMTGENWMGDIAGTLFERGFVG